MIVVSTSNNDLIAILFV